jgi:hypothetical protein
MSNPLTDYLLCVESIKYEKFLSPHKIKHISGLKYAKSVVELCNMWWEGDGRAVTLLSHPPNQTGQRQPQLNWNTWLGVLTSVSVPVKKHISTRFAVPLFNCY